MYRKLFILLFSLCLTTPTMAETYLQCDWSAEAHNAMSGQWMGNKNYSKVFKIDNNQIYDGDKLLKSVFTTDKIVASDEYRDSNKAKIKKEYTINRITGNIDYFSSYEDGVLIKFIVTEKGNGSCKVINNKPKF